MLASAQRFEFGSTNEGSDSASTNLNLMPDMTDRRVNLAYEQVSQTSLRDYIPPFQIVDEALEARKRVVSITAKTLSTGELKPGSTEAEVLRAAIEHQLIEGGARAADALAPLITSQLPDGMYLVIRRDAGLDGLVRELADRNGQPVPTYIRMVDLIDRHGKVLGSIGITGDAFANERKNRTSNLTVNR